MQNITDTFSKAIPPRLAEVITSGRFSAENVVAVMRKMLTGEGDLTGEQELMLSYVCTDSSDTNGICLSTCAEVSTKSESKRDRWRKAKQRQRQRKSAEASKATESESVVSLEDIAASVSPGVVLDDAVQPSMQPIDETVQLSQEVEADNVRTSPGFASMDELELRRIHQRPTLAMVIEAARKSNCGITEEFAKQFYAEMEDRGFTYISHGRTVNVNKYTFQTTLRSWWDRRNGQTNGPPHGGQNRFTGNIPVCY